MADLDGTLCRTDTLHEAILKLAVTDPLQLLKLPLWAARGKTHLKAEIAARVILQADELALDEKVVELVQSARDEGRKTALVSASHQRQVETICRQTGLFDDCKGSSGLLNLKGANKARYLQETYGEKGFDYIGDARADVPVWQAARRAITVGAGPGLRASAERANPDVLHLSPPDGVARSLLKAMRPHQWSKNLLLFVPLLAAHDLSALNQVLVGFLAFCLTASTVYVINDLLDLASDRAHPRKRHRPFASGRLSAPQGLLLATVLISGAGLLGTLTGRIEFLAVLAFYFAATFAYSTWLKRKLIIDVLMLGGLYTMRILAGGAAGDIDLSPWMLTFSVFIFLALAAVKRQAELTDQLASGRSSAGRAYVVDDLPILRGVALSAGQSAVLVLALYISSEDVRSLYAYPGLLWLICPLLLYWVLRMVMKTHRGAMSDDPIVFAATDRVSMLIVLGCALLAYSAAVWPWAVVRI